MIDLESFPDSAAAKRMMKTVSPIYDEAYVAKWLYQVMGEELDGAWDIFDELRLQLYPETATWGIIYWEQRYHIAPDDSLTIEERRNKVIVKRGKRAPMNPARIEQITQNVTGREAVATEQNGESILSVAILPGESEVNYDEFMETMNSVKPSHISLNVLFQTDIGISIQTTSQDQYKFDYPLAGTTPDINTVGALVENIISLDPKIEGTPFVYPAAGIGNTGEYPETNTVGVLAERNIDLSTDINGTPFIYPNTGINSAGEYPETNTVGDLNQGVLSADISADASVFAFKLCGDENKL